MHKLTHMILQQIQIHVLNIHTHTDPANIEVVENTGYGVGTPDTRQRTTTGGIELKPNLVYSNIAADHGNQTEKNGDHSYYYTTCSYTCDVYIYWLQKLLLKRSSARTKTHNHKRSIMQCTALFNTTSPSL